MREKLIVALDYSDEKQALQTVDLLKDTVSIFKVGMELYYHCGPEILDKIHSRGCRVFLDLKFHDIPNTVAGAVKAAVSKNVYMLNLHISGGMDMMKRAVETAGEYAVKQGIPRPRVLGVTVLTSIDDAVLNQELGIDARVKDKVIQWSKLGQQAGLDGVVASPREIADIKKACGEEFLIVTPGIRPNWAAKDDQKRITTPSDAVKQGVSYIVVGRPITKAEDPRKAAINIIQEMKEAGNQ